MAGFIAITLGGAVLITASEGGTDAETAIAVRATVPAGAHSLYVYRGSAPESVSSWHHCFALNGDAGTRTPSVLASPGQREWNFLAYAQPDCPVSDGAEPLTAARNVTAPTELTTWSVVLH